MFDWANLPSPQTLVAASAGALTMAVSEKTWVSALRVLISGTLAAGFLGPEIVPFLLAPLHLEHVDVASFSSTYLVGMSGSFFVEFIRAVWQTRLRKLEARTDGDVH